MELFVTRNGLTSDKGRLFAPNELKIIKTYRFEGTSDPSEEAIGNRSQGRHCIGPWPFIANLFVQSITPRQHAIGLTVAVADENHHLGAGLAAIVEADSRRNPERLGGFHRGLGSGRTE